VAAISPLQASQVLDTVRQVREADARVVRYSTWVVEAWRVLQWPEPTAKLFWEMLSLFQPPTGGWAVLAQGVAPQACAGLGV
jgi:hypothetical protein